jgi:flagellar biosynthesis/type III secretory pathway protein FliH
VLVKPLSSLEPKVSWRLNDLLRAGHKARAFAAVNWSSPGDQSSKAFKQWHPDKLDDANEYEIKETEMSENNEIEASFERPSISEDDLYLIKQDAYEAGFSAAKGEAESSFAEAKQVLAKLTEDIRDNQKNKHEFYNPLKKLALHLAEQLVRGELNISDEAINRLVKAALDDVQASGEDHTVLNLHPSDLEKIQPNLGSDFSHLELRADSQISQGSLRLTIGDTAIEDLLENRLQVLAEDLLNNSQTFKSHSESTSVPEESIEGEYERDVSTERSRESTADETDVSGKKDFEDKLEDRDDKSFNDA